MKSLSKAVGHDLQWVSIKWWKRDYELRAGDEVWAKLYKEKQTGRIIGEAADGRWVFKRRSFWNAEIVITEADSQVEIAVAKRGRNQSILFSDGRILLWKKTSLWRSEWDWVDDMSGPLLHFQRTKHVAIEPAALLFPDLSLLVIIGWHLIVLKQEEDAAAASG